MAGTNVGSIEYIARINTSDFKKDASEIEKSAHKVGGSMESGMVSASKSVAIGLAAAGAAAVAFGAFSLKAFSEAEAGIAQTNAVLKSTGGVAGVTADQVDKLSKAFQKTTKYSDEEVRSAQNMLLTFTNINKDVFPQTTETVLNMSAALGQDLKASSIQLGKALQDPIQGVSALRRVGVNFTESQKEQIKTLVDSGKTMEAQKLILKELNTEFGGSAVAAGNTFGGSIAKLKNQFNDFQEVIGGSIAKTFTPLLASFTKWVEAAGGVEGITKKLGDTITKYKPEIQAVGILLMTLVVPALWAWASAAAVAAANTLIALAPVIAVGAALGALWIAYQRLTPVRKIVDGIVDAMVKLWQAMQPVVDFVAGIFTEIWKSLGSIFKQLAEQFKPVVEAMKEFYTKHAKGIQQALKIIGVVVGVLTFGPLILAIGIVIGALKLLSVILKFAADHFKGIANIVKGVFLVAISPIIAIVLAVIVVFKALKAIIGFLIDVFQVAATVISTVVTTIATVITTVMTAIWNVISPILNFIKNLFIVVFGGILLLVVGVLTAIFNVFKTIFTAIWTFLQPIIQAIINFFVTRWNNLVANTKMVFNALLSFFTTIWNAIYGVISGVVTKIINFFAPAVNWLFDKGKAIFQGLINGLKAIAGGIWNAIKAGADPIGNFFAGAGNWLFDAGKAIFQGLINGIKNIAGRVEQTAKDVMSKVRNLFPFSPAKEGPFSGKGWTVYSGRSMMKGLATGIKKSSSLPADAMQEALGGVQTDFATPGLNSVGQLAGSTTEPATKPVANHIGQVNINSEIDGKYWLNKLNGDQEIALDGLTPQGAI